MYDGKVLYQNLTILLLVYYRDQYYGSCFFILFVNDSPKSLKYSNVTIYADDTSQDVTDKSVDIIETKLICDLKSSMNWMNENKLTMNLKKTQCMLVGTKQRLSNVEELILELKILY